MVIDENATRVLHSSDDQEDEEELSKLKKSNETVVGFDFDENECDYEIITSDLNIRFPADFLQYACGDFATLPKEIDLSNVCGEDLIRAFSFYIPRTNR